MDELGKTAHPKPKTLWSIKMERIIRGTSIDRGGQEIDLPYIVQEDDEIFVPEIIVEWYNRGLLYIAANQDGIHIIHFHGVNFYPVSWIKDNCTGEIRDRCHDVVNAALNDGYLPFSAGKHNNINTGGY